MMFGYDNGMNGWGYALMALGMLGFWALAAIAAFALLRHRPAGAGRTPLPPARQLLAERFARGEIDDDEYFRRSAVLDHDNQPQNKGR
jgi:putative membrane protein